MAPAPGPRAVLVTGAARGIGRAVAMAFAQQGDRVAVHVRSAVDEGGVLRSDGGASKGRGTLAALPGTGHALVVADLGDADQAARLPSDAEEALGEPVTVLVNNAGIATSTALAHPPATTDSATWQRHWETYLRVNTLGPSLVTHAMTRRLVELGLPGRVISIGTRGVHKGEPDFPAYAASKAALHAMDASLAVALAPHGIAVATVAPGFIETERVADKLASPAGDEIRAGSPFGRVGRPEEVASAVLWLASPEAVWASGATLDLNGASHLRP
ncbi:SDR family NAD(P)-dependent oxidoreductase [Janibacter limosus]|uniref:SDR family oxidoreductase n=1 Tax=Janibacter limosus TaxID=53458 RepID=A0A4P6MPL1_9MICO|nr:SDR family oxidoreductase [Janibacter limosus]QBF44839.1 SDR family oxidoreductase [Janibacter limosus]